MCSCGLVTCSCYRAGQRDGFRSGFRSGYLSGYEDGVLGVPPLIVPEVVEPLRPKRLKCGCLEFCCCPPKIDWVEVRQPMTVFPKARDLEVLPVIPVMPEPPVLRVLRCGCIGTCICGASRCRPIRSTFLDNDDVTLPGRRRGNDW